jgi:hypothetical protein
MIASKKTSKKSKFVSTEATSPVAPAAPVAVPVPVAAATPVAPAAPAVPVTASAPVTAPAPATSSVKLPPANANIPAPPQGFVPTNASDYRGLLPKKTELAVLPGAVAELKRFTDFALTFGKTVPSLPVVLATLDAAEQWSSMRAKSTEWDLFCRTEEGLAWKDARDVLGTMRPAFNMAIAVDGTIASNNPSIARLIAANATIAQRGVATRTANRQAKEKGEPPTKGKAAKKAKKLAKAEAAAAASIVATAPATPAAPSPAAQPTVTATPVTVSPAAVAPVVTAPAASAVAPAPVVSAPGLNGVTNGAGH